MEPVSAKEAFSGDVRGIRSAVAEMEFEEH
jgi:fructose 1,6-bisphosphatase